SLASARGMPLSFDDRLRGFCIRSLMCNLRLVFAEVEQRFGVRPQEVLGAALAALQPYAAQGFVTVSPEAIVVAPRGRLVIRNLVMPFDRYLQGLPGAGAAEEESPRFSQTL
ncbi:MAG: coproporphyrinogen III oxidase, partial [Deltaproteobacteria bacterium]|nr:coproporphyrinogen III oxidase [Deltaproteobacteria bacterium]